ncbi:MAG: aryl-sulfate sulfotransferase [Bacteroidetes bacterium]|nr:aryl-sulfate sulfotransferase [Bacteroidota bacterium]
MKNHNPIDSMLVVLVLLIATSVVRAQDDPYVELKYVSPVPGSKYVMPMNNIALRQGEALDAGSLRSHLLTVKSNKGDKFAGRLILSDDNRTLLFLPEEPYPLGQVVYVELQDGLKTRSGKKIKPLNFQFETTQKIIKVDRDFMKKYILDKPINLHKPVNKTVENSTTPLDNNYPEGYAFAQVLVDNSPPDGYYFYTPYNEWALFPDTDPYISIIDKYGVPVYYRKLQQAAYDLKIQPNGLLSFYSFHPYWGNIVMDSSFRFLDKFQMGNGYSYTDFHEFQMLENGHAFVMTYDAQLIDMSQIVPGGDTAAIVSGFVFQELDSDHNVVFQWRSWDHYEITETGPEVDLLDEQIDYVHGNTIEVESNTSLLISSRNFHEITKIDRNTGEIIWRLGGSQNQFDFGTDTLRFSRQHDSRRIYNGHVTAFDNGTFHPDPKFSSAVEYAINTDSMTATLVNRYRHDPDYLGTAMGNAFWTPDESIVIGWGTTLIGISEMDLQGNLLWETKFEGMSYRAYRFPWKTNYFSTEKDTLNFSYVWYQDSTQKSLEIYNPQPFDIDITSTYNMTGHFKSLDTYPVTVPAGGLATLSFRFIPDSVGTFQDILTINSDIQNDTLVQRIAQQVQLVGYSTEGQGIADKTGWNVACYPNPVKDVLKVEFDGFAPKVFIEVKGLAGNILLRKETDHTSATSIDCSQLSHGVFLITIISVESGEQHSFKIIKM